MTNDLFDLRLRAHRRDRAARKGPELFLLDRTFDDCLERLDLVRRKFSSALLLGCPNPDWPGRLRQVCEEVAVFDPGAMFAAQARGVQSDEVDLPVAPGAFDLIVAIGTLDTANSLSDALLRLRLALRPGGLLLGALSGGETLLQLRAAMRAADEASGAASPHVHPRIDPPGLAATLGATGLEMPVVDVDRVQVRYETLAALVRDLRGMAATNLLSRRRRAGLSKSALAAAEQAFQQAGSGGKTSEVFEILNFAGWAPAAGQSPADEQG